MKGKLNSRVWTEQLIKSLLGKATSDLVPLEKCDKSELIKVIRRIAISDYVAHDWCHNEVIRIFETLDQLTEALNHWIRVEKILNIPSFVALKP